MGHLQSWLVALGGRLLELWGWELVERDCVLDVGKGRNKQLCRIRVQMVFPTQSRKENLKEINPVVYTSNTLATQRQYPNKTSYIHQFKTQSPPHLINKRICRPISLPPPSPFPGALVTPPRLPFTSSTLRSQSETIFVNAIADVKAGYCVDDYIACWFLRRGLLIGGNNCTVTDRRGRSLRL